MFAISNTDRAWFNFLKQLGLNSHVNFWTPTPWNIRGLQKNARLYFMLKSPIRKIAGFGEFQGYQNLTAKLAWDKFGYRNGCYSKEVLIERVQSYIDKNSRKFGGVKIDADRYEIGCIELNNCEFWDEGDFIDLIGVGVEFPKQVVTIKFFKQYDLIRINEKRASAFALIKEPSNKKKSLTLIREGQGEFRGLVLRAYGNRCCISGEVIPELLEAAHIQPYTNRCSNHIQNGLLMRVDLHRLFDNGLLYIDRNFFVHISKVLLNTAYYEKYNGVRIQLPDDAFEFPSPEALESRRSDFRE